MGKKMQWRSQFERNLARHGLPSEYIRRLSGELDDHYQELSEAGESHPHERLGDTEDLANAAISAYQSQTFFGHRPVVGFVFGPVVLALLAWLAYYASVLFVVWMGYASLENALQQRSVVTTLVLGGRIIPPILAGSLLIWLARRSGRSLRWFALSIGLLALFCFFGPFAEMQLPTLMQPRGRVSIGFPFRYTNQEQVSAQMVQTLVALVTSGIVLVATRFIPRLSSISGVHHAAKET